MGEKHRDEKKSRRLGKKLRDLEEKLSANEGRRIKLKIRALNSTYNVFLGNYRDLVRALDHIADTENSIELFALDNRDQLDAVMGEVTRLFHNFLAGAKTLVDHTRVFKNELYEGKSFDEVYQAKVERDLAGSSVVSFVQDLRNYVLHKQLPLTSAEISFQSGEGGTIKNFDTSIKINVSRLREWRGWTRKSRIYLDALDDKVKIKEVAEQYEAAIKSFYRWFGEQLEQSHRIGFDELRSLEKQYKQVWQEWERSW